VLFPKYRERYLRDAWPAVTKALKEVRDAGDEGRKKGE